MNFNREIVVTTKRTKDVVKVTRYLMAIGVNRTDYGAQMRVRFVNSEESIRNSCVLCQGANLCFPFGVKLISFIEELFKLSSQL